MFILPPLTVSRTGANIRLVERIQSEEADSPREPHAERSHRSRTQSMQSCPDVTAVHIKPQASDKVAIGQPPPYTVDTVGDAPPDPMEAPQVASTPLPIQPDVVRVDHRISSRKPVGESKW